MWSEDTKLWGCAHLSELEWQRGSLHELEPCTKFKTHTVAHPGGSSLERLRPGWFFMQF